jgi:hypothetical protein
MFREGEVDEKEVHALGWERETNSDVRDGGAIFTSPCC